MEWKEVRLGDYIKTNEIQYSIKENWENFVYLDTGSIIEGRIDKLLYFTKEDKLPSRARRKVQHGDIIYSCVRPNQRHYGYINIPVENLLVSTGFVVISCKNIDSKYLYYYLTQDTIINYLQNIGEQSVSTYPTIKPQDIEDIFIRIPSDIEDQRRIASILSSLDRKIELNNKINADLEEMAQAIFKNWFVDFEPFKDGKFVNSELGMIPEGWKVVAFDNILKVTTMKTGKEGIPEYSVTNTGIHPRDEKFTKNLSKSSAKNKLIRKGNLVFGMSREILNWGIMKEEVGGVSSAYNVYLVDENIVNTIYLECFIAQRMDYFADLIKPASREGQGVDKALLLKKIICIPPSEIMDVFLEKYDSIMHLAEIRKQESSHLSLLRDTLLPRLMSGELEIPE